MLNVSESIMCQSTMWIDLIIADTDVELAIRSGHRILLRSARLYQPTFISRPQRPNELLNRSPAVGTAPQPTTWVARLS